MKKHRRALKIGLVLMMIILVVIILVRFFVRTGNFVQVSGIRPSQISKITVQADWGANKTITSKTDIQEIIDILNAARYSRNGFQPASTGYLYKLDFYEQNHRAGELILGSYPIIDSIQYKAGIDMDKIEKTAGLYPPKR